jgi:hypothetical protein
VMGAGASLRDRSDRIEAIGRRPARARRSRPKSCSGAMRPFKVAPDRFEHEGWQSQLARVERWHIRALSAVSNGEAHAEDYIYALFQCAYHLRDWLQNSGAACQRELDELMSRNPALKLCRDVCNGSKHFTLDQRTTTDQIGLMREYLPPSGPGREPGERPGLIVFEGQDGTVNIQRIEELIDARVTAWRDFCRSLGALGSRVPGGS